VKGEYSYVDANGKLQKVQYVADASGFHVADSRLPTFNPEALTAPIFNPDLPVAPEDTAEVAEAKAAHFAAIEAAKSAEAALSADISERKKREARFSYQVSAVHPIKDENMLSYNYLGYPNGVNPFTPFGYGGLQYPGFGYGHLGYGGHGYGFPYYG